MAGQQEQRERRAAYNHALFRSANERLEELNGSVQELAPYGSWMCECFRPDCTEMVEMTLAEYEELRRRPDRFVVVADLGHVDPEVETVTEHGERFWAGEKTGEAAMVAHQLDERAL